jgi:hypothetical protein
MYFLKTFIIDVSNLVQIAKLPYQDSPKSLYEFSDTIHHILRTQACLHYDTFAIKT